MLLDWLLQAGGYEICSGNNRLMAAQADTYVYLEKLEEATPSYFTAAFRHFMGCTPREWLKENKKDG